MAQQLELTEALEEAVGHAKHHVVMVEVESSNLAQVGYDDDRSLLLLEFKNGGKFAYPNVERETFDDMMDADSIGKFFFANIKKLDYIKLED